MQQFITTIDEHSHTQTTKCAKNQDKPIERERKQAHKQQKPKTHREKPIINLKIRHKMVKFRLTDD